MRLSQFIVETQEDLDRFAEYWEKQRANNPHDWPESMSEADWMEQYITFCTSDDIDGES